MLVGYISYEKTISGSIHPPSGGSQSDSDHKVITTSNYDVVVTVVKTIEIESEEEE